MASDKNEKAKVDAFIEELGELFDRAGQQRIAGRLLGWLLVCDPPEQSAGDIEEATGASKASVSINLRLLQAAGLVDRVGVPGQRRAYYRLRTECWRDDLRAKLAELSQMRKIAEHGLEILKDEPPERTDRLRAMHDFYTFFEGAFPALVERWEEEMKPE